MAQSIEHEPAQLQSSALSADGRVAWVDVARGCSIILVVAYHANIFLTAHGVDTGLYAAMSDLLQPLRMPLFFAISGMLAASAIGRDWRRLLHDKIALFLHLFVLWSLIHLVMFKHVVTHPSADVSGDLLPVYLKGLVQPQTGIWFIWALAGYFAVAKLVRGRPLIAGAAAVLISAATFHPALDRVGLNFAQLNALRYLPFFLIPALFGKGFAARIPGNLPRVAMLLAVSLAIWVAARIGHEMPLMPSLSGLAVNVAGLCAGLIVSVRLARVAMLRPFLAHVGCNTLPIYLIHLLVLAAVVPLVASPAAGPLRAIVLPGVVAFAVAASLLAARAIKATGQHWLLRRPRRSELRPRLAELLARS